jgi:hypothetical protein
VVEVINYYRNEGALAPFSYMIKTTVRLKTHISIAEAKQAMQEWALGDTEDLLRKAIIKSNLMYSEWSKFYMQVDFHDEYAMIEFKLLFSDQVHWIVETANL